ncbi:MAG: hypothetical protein IAE97_06360 [Chthoniobacterales bacterium]|nr:hypothetical protein [Chthoniobacterales bacterium]
MEQFGAGVGCAVQNAADHARAGRLWHLQEHGRLDHFRDAGQLGCIEGFGGLFVERRLFVGRQFSHGLDVVRFEGVLHDSLEVIQAIDIGVGVGAGGNADGRGRGGACRGDRGPAQKQAHEHGRPTHGPFRGTLLADLCDGLAQCLPGRGPEFIGKGVGVFLLGGDDALDQVEHGLAAFRGVALADGLTQLFAVDLHFKLPGGPLLDALEKVTDDSHRTFAPIGILSQNVVVGFPGCLLVSVSRQRLHKLQLLVASGRVGGFQSLDGRLRLRSIETAFVLEPGNGGQRLFRVLLQRAREDRLTLHHRHVGLSFHHLAPLGRFGFDLAAFLGRGVGKDCLKRGLHLLLGLLVAGFDLLPCGVGFFDGTGHVGAVESRHAGNPAIGCVGRLGMLGGHARGIDFQLPRKEHDVARFLHALLPHPPGLLPCSADLFLLARGQFVQRGQFDRAKLPGLRRSVVPVPIFDGVSPGLVFAVPCLHLIGHGREIGIFPEVLTMPGALLSLHRCLRNSLGRLPIGNLSRLGIQLFDFGE